GIAGGADHPRVCGKDQADSPPQHLQGGSPPRMRERHLEEPLFIEVCVLATPEIYSLLLTTWSKKHIHKLFA
ncbi:MAG: hypothetical protein ACE3NC_02420, partial [Candidatus Wallacebacter cryptica]